MKAWPTSGIICASWITRPAAVVASSSGSDQSSARLRSRIETEPSTSTEPSGWGATPATSWSCSSSISPTISSRMSSSVTRPITSPYSSTTTAKWVRRLRKAFSWSTTRVASGTNQGGLATVATLTFAMSPFAACTARTRSFTWRTPTMFSVVPRQSGIRV